jgi:superfamily I DNA/RNA helicase
MDRAMSFDFHLPTNQELQGTATGKQMRQYAEEDDFGRMLLTGCAGSGKTTVAILRLIRLIRQGRAAKLFTFHKMLVMVIRKILRDQDIKESHMHCGTLPLIENFGLNPKMGEYIIDEGQDLERIVYELLPNHCNRLFVSADDAQQVHQGRATVAEIRNVLERMPQFREHQLDRNFRNTYEIYRFARQFQNRGNEVVWDNNMLAHMERENRGEEPLVVEYANIPNRNDHMIAQMRNAIGRGGSIAVLCPLGSTTKEKCDGESAQSMFGLLRRNSFNCTLYYSDESVPKDLGDVLVTTYKSAKGLEFDEVFIPRYNFFKDIPNEWYVACTRARRRLVIYRDMKHRQKDPIANFDPQTYERFEFDATSPF